MDIKASLEGLVTLLKAAGLSADLDNRKLNAPCAWVHPGDITPRDLQGGYTMAAQVTLVSRNTSPLGNLESLNTMLDKALTVIEPDTAIETDRTAAMGDKVLPAFTFTVNLDL